MDYTIEEQAHRLLTFSSSQCSNPDGLGSFSPSVYDTAWISMVAKEYANGTKAFLFPEAFTYLLETQMPDGSWPSYSASIDGILNTLAALLALKTRGRMEDALHSEFDKRCCRAEKALRSMLGDWDIKSTDRVGFEVLVPGLLRLLEEQGIHFQFRGRKELVELGESKRAIGQHLLKGTKQTTLLHSLEAFVGVLNYDDVQHYKLPNGSMLNSPASTAAYLSKASEWDTEAEGYLRMVVDQYRLKGHKGGVPTAYPTSMFELSWTVATLLQSGFTTQELGLPELNAIADYIADTVKAEGGVVGFAPACLADADDTAKALTVLNMLNRDVSIEPMLAEFERDKCFITYRGERNASFSANCNVLLCLLDMPEKRKYTARIVKCAKYIENLWRSGKVQDKWNTSSHYSTMLLAQAFVGIIREASNGNVELAADVETLVYTRLPATLLDVLIRTIESQNSDGSWDSKHEVSAYAVIALSWLLSIPWPESIRAAGVACLERGKTFMVQNRHLWNQGDHIWIEKVAYSLSNLSEMYCLAAAKISVPTINISETVVAQPDKRLVKFFSRIEPFSKGPSWKADACVAQSSYFVRTLQASKLQVFPEMEKTSNHEYLQFIPFTWLGCNHFYGSGVASEVLWEMMLVSMLNFQVDAYMETVIGVEFLDQLAETRRVIDRSCGEYIQGRQKRPREDDEGRTDLASKRRQGRSSPAGGESTPRPTDNHDGYNSYDPPGNVEITPPSSEPSMTSIRDVETTLRGFTTHILKHPMVLRSPIHLQKWLYRSLRQFLHAHVTHIEDCVLVSQDGFPDTTYHSWVHTTSADHTSCPFSFVFYLCLMHGRHEVKVKESVDLFPGAQAKYLLEDACRHLATMCRQHNDFGSVRRDREEKNLNSINFPEFQGRSKQNEQVADDSLNHDAEVEVKECLLEIAEYERSCLNLALSGLRNLVDDSVMSELNLFFEVTDLYGRIYLSRDIGIRRKG